jgi:hypothetical protein
MMGLDELNLLKETLLNIDEIDDKINAVNQETKEFSRKIDNKKGIITDLENQIIENNKQVKKGEKSSQEIINLYSDLESKIHQKQIRDSEREQKITLWKNELETYWKDSYKKNGGLFYSYLIVPIVTFGLVIMALDRFTQLSEDISDYIAATVFCLSIVILVEISNKNKLKKSQTNKEELESKFGKLGNFNTSKFKIFRYNGEQKYGAYCVSKGEAPGAEVYNFSNEIINSEMDKWFGRIPSHLAPEILFPSWEENSKNERIEKERLNLKKLKDYVAKGEKAILTIPRNKEQIARDSEEIKQLETFIESNNNRIKQLEGERANLWDSISHMIPYSNLIKQ